MVNGKPQRLWKVAAALVLVLAVFFSSTGCGRKEPLADPVQAYMEVIKELEAPEAFNQEEGLAYLALDSRAMKGLAGKDDEKRIFAQLAEIYSVEILEKNQVQLAQGGYLLDNQFQDGVLFKILDADYTTFDKSPVYIDVQEWGRGNDTMIHRRFTLELSEGVWEITDSEDVTKKTLN